MIGVIRYLLQKCIDRIDSGNCNITSDEQIEVIKLLKKYTDKERRLSKYQACEYLNISRATFDRLVKENKLLKGKKESGFKELFYLQSDLDKYKKRDTKVVP